MPDITVAAPPTATDVTSIILAIMAAETGTLTDYNQGSQIRTIAESIGAVCETQGITSQALAFQALVYSAMSLFAITPGLAQSASGQVVLSTSNLPSPPGASQNVTIPAGTIVATNGGIQFATTVVAQLPQGSSTVTIPIQAVVPGAAGNVPPGSILQIVSGLTYPLFASNPAATAGGRDPENPVQTLARFTAAVAAIGLSTPVAIANSAIGVFSPDGTESVLYSTLYEPWIAAGSGAGSGTAGWTLFLDNGAGTASNALIAAVTAKLNGGSVSGSANAGGPTGYRDAGVPFLVRAVTPTRAVVVVSGTVDVLATAAVVSGAIAQAVSGYFTLPFGAPALQAQIAAAAANAGLGQLDSLAVFLFASGSPTAVSGLVPPIFGRVILGTLNVNLIGGQ
jgi:hypothetical protein